MANPELQWFFDPTRLTIKTDQGTVNILPLVIGTDVQAQDATLQSLSALGTAADKIAYTTAVDTWAESALTAFARTLLDDTDAATARNTLGASAGIWPIALGGTGASTAVDAFTAIKQSATDIATGVVELATNTEALAGTDTTRAVTSAGLASSKSLAISGYMKLPGGFILQWGTVTSGGVGNTAVTFPIAFPTECARISLAINLDAANLLSQTGWNSKTTTGFNFYNPQANIIISDWMAIGY